MDTYLDIATRLVKPGIGGVRLRELSTQRVDGYLSGCTAHKRHIRTVLMQSCSLGVRWGLLAADPVRETEPAPRPKSDKRVLHPGGRGDSA
ncbi:hypothetical protein H7J07_00065 [Mycobacterium koreense]|uniref:Uncharacterized protein n=1 Tax=Mycolicibacillus koreensis TaxID=1069220 RepID=A0A7I7SGX8_9MYCO|nr:hypothetical protein [Mycolicibacillus koreensis]MCV7246659.1 hypothetical protein [Mycolicibacillus koreensis]OSC25224.1 hypothetical protein B8W67_19140 [Mycolicibacillus koreensis]BBY56088.1 hypothetical protein MKOR_33390 [Mycolicibacillus koreensis]